jgi:YidC/Oxa1 family membrane protein insertase
MSSVAVPSVLAEKLAFVLITLCTPQLQNRYAAPSQQATLKIMTWVLGPLSIFFTMHLPSGVTFYFALAALLGVVQNSITIQPWFRRWAGLPILQPPPVSASAYQPPRGASAFTVVKEQLNHVLKEARSSQGGMMQRMQMKAEADKEEKARERRDEDVRSQMWKRVENKRR